MPSSTSLHQFPLFGPDMPRRCVLTLSSAVSLVAALRESLKSMPDGMFEFSIGTPTGIGCDSNKEPKDGFAATYSYRSSQRFSPTIASPGPARNIHGLPITRQGIAVVATRTTPLITDRFH